MVRQYECILIFDPTLDETVLTQEIKTAEDFIKNNGGNVSNKSVPKKTVLGYRIKRRKEGHYIILDFTLDTTKVKEFNNVLNLKETLLRFNLIVKKEKAAVA
ncbi:MAG: 30S ribosomal protein S6 [Candidatus Omnitrophica bacterium]|nr:30S ribosomal protein S6 [Candidatus Omnitrophota bacterium]